MGSALYASTDSGKLYAQFFLTAKVRKMLPENRRHLTPLCEKSIYWDSRTPAGRGGQACSGGAKEGLPNTGEEST